MKGRSAKGIRWTISEAAGAIGAQFFGPDIPVPLSFKIDSREVSPGDVFVALEGEKQDGHSFIEESIVKGAGALILDASKAGGSVQRALGEKIPVILTDNTGKALRDLSRKWLEILDPSNIIAITGTVGKTTTREMIRTVLSGLKGVSCAEKSFKTWIGCALTVMGSPPGTNILVLEFGTSHPGEIRTMAEDYHPHIGVITEIGPGHLEGLGSVSGVLKAKLELMDSPTLRVMSYNYDNIHLSRSLAKMRREVTGLPVGKRSPLYRISQTRFEVVEGSLNLQMVFNTPSGERKLRSELFGEHNAYAAGFAMAVADTLKVPPEDQVLSLSNFKALPGRGKAYFSKNGYFIIDDTYNANPVSMAGALNTLSTMDCKGRKWAVLGGMGELGAGSDRLHKSMFKFFKKVDGVFLIGESWEKVADSSVSGNHSLSSLEELEGQFRSTLSRGDVVLFKGSRSFRIERAIRILEGLA